MKYLSLPLSSALACMLAMPVMADVALTSDEQKSSYSIGYDVGQQVQRNIPDFDLNALLLGVKDAMQGKDLRLSFKELQTAVKHMQAKQQATVAKAAGDNLHQGKDYLAKHAKKSGVTVLDNGLQYEVIRQGKGAKPKSTDTVKVHYHGRLIDGTVFDSSVDRGEPVSFPVNGVIEGWQKILPLMPVGSKWTVTIPSDLAYGEQGAGGSIGPNEVLIFDIDLLSIQ